MIIEIWTWISWVKPKIANWMTWMYNLLVKSASSYQIVSINNIKLYLILIFVLKNKKKRQLHVAFNSRFTRYIYTYSEGVREKKRKRERHTSPTSESEDGRKASIVGDVGHACPTLVKAFLSSFKVRRVSAFLFCLR